jgi:hypothetical protein
MLNRRIRVLQFLLDPPIISVPTIVYCMSDSDAFETPMSLLIQEK